MLLVVCLSGCLLCRGHTMLAQANEIVSYSSVAPHSKFSVVGVRLEKLVGVVGEHCRDLVH